MIRAELLPPRGGGFAKLPQQAAHWAGAPDLPSLRGGITAITSWQVRDEGDRVAALVGMMIAYPASAFAPRLSRIPVTHEWCCSPSAAAGLFDVCDSGSIGASDVSCSPGSRMSSTTTCSARPSRSLCSAVSMLAAVRCSGIP